MMPQIFNCLSSDYGDLFIKNIEEFIKHAENNRNYAVFYPSFGTRKSEKTEFLIYGQSIKGWTPEFNTSHKFKKTILQDAIEFSNSFYKENNHSPLDWVNVYWSKSQYRNFVKTKSINSFYPPIDYSPCNSFFWNVTYKLVSRYNKFDECKWDWSKKMVWSNLYKIAPAERKNPNTHECLLQEHLSIKLVKKEIEEINPKFCIVITNDSWWQMFRKELKTQSLPINKLDKSVIESVEQYNDTKIIITTRPFRGSNEKHVSQILDLLN